MDRFKYIFWFFPFILLNCETKEVLPNQPDSVVKHWQTYVNENDFAQAKKLSTPNAIEWINWIEKMLPTEYDVEEPQPIFHTINCEEAGQKATCICLVEELGETYQDTFFLLQIKNQWLVDIPQEDLESNESLEEMLKTMHELLQEE